jgi:hypothetical protein
MSRKGTTAKSRRNLVPYDFQDRNTPVEISGGYYTMQDGSRQKCARRYTLLSTKTQ